MSVRNSCTVRFRWPLPPAAIPDLQVIFTSQGFGHEWDEETVNLSRWNGPPDCPMNFYARDVSWDEQRDLVAIARTHKFSIIVHTDWDEAESECAGSLHAYDAVDRRVLDCMATRNAMRPLLELDDALRMSHEDLKRHYALPKDLV